MILKRLSDLVDNDVVKKTLSDDLVKKLMVLLPVDLFKNRL